jgi:hypothetical protein
MEHRIIVKSNKLEVVPSEPIGMPLVDYANQRFKEIYSELDGYNVEKNSFTENPTTKRIEIYYLPGNTHWYIAVSKTIVELFDMSKKSNVRLYLNIADKQHYLYS